MIPIAQLLDKALKKSPVAKRIKGQIIVDAWPDAVGEIIAMKTEALVLENGTLIVRVCDSVWAQHLSLQKKQIITKLNRTTKTRVLTDIRYHVGKMQHNIEPITIHKKIEPWRQQILNPEELTSIENSFSQTDLPPDLASSMKALFVAQRKRLSWVIKQGEPVCEVCGLPLVKTAKETYCLSCKTEDNG